MPKEQENSAQASFWELFLLSCISHAILIGESAGHPAKYSKEETENE